MITEGLERTVDSHIKNLRRKVEADIANPTYIETIFGVGYCIRSGETHPRGRPRMTTVRLSSFVVFSDCSG